MLAKADEWNELDFLLAQKILKDRGVEIEEKELESMKEQRFEELAKPQKVPDYWIFFGYLFALFPFLLVGVVIGFFLWTSKKSLPNGKKAYTYTQSDRQHGKYMFVLGVIILLILPFLFNLW